MRCDVITGDKLTFWPHEGGRADRSHFVSIRSNTTLTQVDGGVHRGVLHTEAAELSQWGRRLQQQGMWEIATRDLVMDDYICHHIVQAAQHNICKSKQF